MFLLILLGSIVVLLSGFAIRKILEMRQSQFEIDNKEFLVAGAAMVLVFIPLIAFIGIKVAINSQVTYYENWNGWEKHARFERVTCTRDGICRHCYDCDPYKVKTDCSYTDDKGKRVSKTCEHTEYHKCPYTTEEWTFTIDTTVGSIPMADRNLPTNPEAYRYRSFKSIPDYTGDYSEQGIPPRWQLVKDRLDRGVPDPVTLRHDYDNYILASHSTILKQYSDAIDKYKKAGLFPTFNVSPMDLYYLNRVYFVGTNIPGNWPMAMNRFNAALGSTLQGDLHLVVVDANKVVDADNYHLALLSYWLSPEFGKNALSKNGIVIVIGTADGKTVKWARASTGMPMGNEAMLLQLQRDLQGAQITPEELLGWSTATVSGGSVVTQLPKSLLADILWGTNKYQRVRMKEHGEGSPGYEYLLKELQPTTGQYVGILVCIFLAGLIAWAICARIGLPRMRRFR